MFTCAKSTFPFQSESGQRVEALEIFLKLTYASKQPGEGAQLSRMVVLFLKYTRHVKCNVASK